MSRYAEKVTAFITCGAGDDLHLLLFEHPFAGNQIPAGTVEERESSEEAVRREVAEETGLTSLPVGRYLGSTRDRLPDGQCVVCQPTRVYARPDRTSFDWAFLRRGIRVVVNRNERGFAQVTYQEFDREPRRQYLTMQITGWVPESVLVEEEVRHFYMFTLRDCVGDRWTVSADNHTFTVFWASLEALPPIISPQDQWLEILHAGLRSLGD